MRGVHSAVDYIRRNVFTEVARLAYEGGDLNRVDMIPYKIVPGEVARHRHDVFLERAIVQERVRLALVCLFCSACNMLILDEPTHYLDLPSVQALTQLLQTAGQCVILISHDPALIRQTCMQLLRFENQKLVSLAVEDWSTTRTSKPPLEKTILQMRLISLEEALRQQPENPALQDQRDALIVQLRQFI